LEDAEDTWYTDGSSFVWQGRCKAGYTVTTTDQVIEAKALLPNTSTQKAEIIAPTQALELAKGKKNSTSGLILNMHMGWFTLMEQSGKREDCCPPKRSR